MTVPVYIAHLASMFALVDGALVLFKSWLLEFCFGGVSLLPKCRLSRDFAPEADRSSRTVFPSVTSLGEDIAENTEKPFT